MYTFKYKKTSMANSADGTAFLGNNENSVQVLRNLQQQNKITITMDGEVISQY